MIKLYFLFILQEYYIDFAGIVFPFACVLGCLNWYMYSDCKEDSINVMVRWRGHSLESKRTALDSVRETWCSNSFLNE